MRYADFSGASVRAHRRADDRSWPRSRDVRRSRSSTRTCCGCSRYGTRGRCIELQLLDAKTDAPATRAGPSTRRLRARTRAFSESFAYRRWVVVRHGGEPLMLQVVTGNYFRMLGVGPALGRAISPRTRIGPGAAPVLVMSHRAWTTRFGCDSTIIGQPLRLVRDRTFEIVGVAREGFDGLTDTPPDVWAPLTMASALDDDVDLFGSERAARSKSSDDCMPGMPDGERRAGTERVGAARSRPIGRSVDAGRDGRPRVARDARPTCRRQTMVAGVADLPRVRARVAHRLRERREHDARARHGPAARVRHPSRARRRSASQTRQAAHDGGAAARRLPPASSGFSLRGSRSTSA